MAQKIEIVRGTSNTLQIHVRDATDKPYVIGNGEAIIFGVKKQVEDKELVIKKAAFVEGIGIYNVKLNPSDTESLACGAYVYDVGLQTIDDFFNIIEPNPFVIQSEVTKRGVLNA